MVNCSILGCKSRSERNEPGITFHGFPARHNDRCRWQKWVDAAGRNVKGTKTWMKTTTNKRVCSKHFDKEVFYTINGRRYLKSDAVPILLCHLKPTITLVKTENLLRSLPKDDSASNVKHSLVTRKSSLNDQENQNVKRSLNTRKSSARNQENKNFKHSLNTRKSSLNEQGNTNVKHSLATRKSLSNDQGKHPLDTRKSSLNEQQNTNVKHSLDTRKLSSNDQDDASTVSCVSETGLTEIDSSDLESPLETPCEIKLKKKLKEKENECKGHLGKIEALEATNRRLCEKNKTLKLVLKKLKRKIMVFESKNVKFGSSDEDSSS